MVSLVPKSNDGAPLLQVVSPGRGPGCEVPGCVVVVVVGGIVVLVLVVVVVGGG
jgi:hypothetical protein